MPGTLLDISAYCRNRILSLCLLEDAPIVVDPWNCEAPGLLRTCTQLRAEAKKIFYKGNIFRLHMKDGAMPRKHWINEAARIYERNVTTRIKGQNHELLQEWLWMFYKGETPIYWNPFRPLSKSSKASVEDVLGHGFHIARILQREWQEKKQSQGTAEKEECHHVAKLLLDIWYEIAKNPFKLRPEFKGEKGKKIYRDLMVSLKRYHDARDQGGLRVRLRFEREFAPAFAVVEILSRLEWPTVKNVLRCYFRTWCSEVTEQRCGASFSTA
jgi:virulence-associated protein VapD